MMYIYGLAQIALKLNVQAHSDIYKRPSHVKAIKKVLKKTKQKNNFLAGCHT